MRKKRLRASIIPVNLHSQFTMCLWVSLSPSFKKFFSEKVPTFSLCWSFLRHKRGLRWIITLFGKQMIPRTWQGARDRQIAIRHTSVKAFQRVILSKMQTKGIDGRIL